MVATLVDVCQCGTRCKIIFNSLENVINLDVNVSELKDSHYLNKSN